MKKLVAILTTIVVVMAMMPLGVFGEEAKPLELWNSFSDDTKLVSSYTNIKDIDVSQVGEGKQRIIAVTGDYQLSDDFTIPESTYLDVRANAVLTVNKGVTLTVPQNCVRLAIWPGGKIIVEDGAKIVLEKTQENLKPYFMNNNGTFDGEITLDEGCYEMRNGSNLYAVNVPKENANIEIINNGTSKYFTTAIFERYNLQSGDTVKLLTDVNKCFGANNIDNVTFDLNGKKLITTTKSPVISARSSTVTITDSSEAKNGEITYEGSLTGNWLVKAMANSTIIIEDSATISSENAIGIFPESNAHIIVKGKVKSKNSYAISGNGTDTGNTTIDILPGAELLSENGAAIYNPQNGTLNVSGGTITGKTGIQMCAGILNISGDPVINGTGEWESPTKGDGYVQDGAAVSIINRNYPGGTPDVYISGGLFTSLTNVESVQMYKYDYKDNSPIKDVWEDAPKHITGGVFSSDPTEYKSEVGCYTVTKNDTEPSRWTVNAAHTWDEGTITTEPTYTTEGTKTYRCTTEGCNATKTETVPKKKRANTSHKDNVTNNITEKNTTADLTPSISGSKANTTVDNNTAGKIISKAIANKSTEIIIDAAGGNTVASSEVGIPETTVKELSEKTDANLIIKTDNGKVDLDKTALDAVAAQAGTTGTVKLIVETIKTDENICHVALKLVTSKGNVTDFKGGNVKVTVSLDKELADKELVCVYINDNSIYTIVDGVLNADGTYTFTTGHFSEYAVMPKDDADNVITKQLNALIKGVSLKATTARSAKKNIKVKVSGNIKALTDAGYTVKYKFYRSTKKASKYNGMKLKKTNTYTNTIGKKGTKYYYKAKVMVYDGDKLVGQTALKQCRYGARAWNK